VSDLNGSDLFSSLPNVTDPMCIQLLTVVVHLYGKVKLSLCLNNEAMKAYGWWIYRSTFTSELVAVEWSATHLGHYTPEAPIQNVVRICKQITNLIQY
jgi:hypothetical protein